MSARFPTLVIHQIDDRFVLGSRVMIVVILTRLLVGSVPAELARNILRIQLSKINGDQEEV